MNPTRPYQTSGALEDFVNARERVDQEMLCAQTGKVPIALGTFGQSPTDIDTEILVLSLTTNGIS